MTDRPDLRAAVHAAMIGDRLTRARRTLAVWAVLWVLLGAGTITGLAGTPADAPHLHLSETVRGWALWILPGVIAAGILWRTHSRPTEGATRAAAALLLAGPLVRATSYLTAWLIWLLGEDNLGAGPWYSEGSPAGWYTCTPWWVISAAILTQAWTPRRVIRRKAGHR